MRKYHIVLLGMILLLLGGLFRYNILGFYHEFLLDEVVDLGGHGVEKVIDVVMDEEHNMYVLSKTIDGFVNTEGFIENFEQFLVTKINRKHKVEKSYLVDELMDQTTIKLIPSSGEIKLGKNNEVILLLDYDYWNGDTYEDNTFFLRMSNDLLLTDESEIPLEERSLMLNFVIGEENQIHLFSSEGKQFIFDEEFQLLEERMMNIDPFTILYDFVYKDDSFYFIGKTNESTNYMYVLFKYTLESDSSEVIEYLGGEHIYYELTNDYILYAPYDGDRWDQDMLEVTYLNLDDEEDTFTTSCELPNKENQVANIKYNNERIYVFGYTMTTKRTDATYYAYNLEGEVVDEYISNIGGLDSMNNLFFYEDTIISVIASKRVVNFDLIRRYTQAYDHIIKFID